VKDVCPFSQILHLKKKSKSFFLTFLGIDYDENVIAFNFLQSKLFLINECRLFYFQFNLTRIKEILLFREFYIEILKI